MVWVNVRTRDIINNTKVGRLDVSRWEEIHERRDVRIKEIERIRQQFEFVVANKQ